MVLFYFEFTSSPGLPSFTEVKCHMWWWFSGEWSVKEENKKVKGHLEIPEFSFGELEDLEVKSTLLLRILFNMTRGNLIRPFETIISEEEERNHSHMLDQEMTSCGCIMFFFVW